ncbi:MAG: hypothetical protein JXR51_14990 [Bacteroidales bacterium]|nr:hypothetical protein [Bacteroidales bacterium]MBN2758477.1 hypothetical protein [Bacteroidales bacterium]
MLKVALSHDVDRINKHYQYFTYFLKNLLKADFKKVKYHFSSFFKEEPYWNFPEIIKIEESFNVKSTFFILDESIPFNLFDKNNWQLSIGRYHLFNEKLVEIIKWLDKNGWEIGVHGSYNSFNNKELLNKEKKRIESIVEHEIIGTRQHYLNWNQNTWNIQKEIGFKYDSTWGHTTTFGTKEDKITPFKPFNDYFLEIPLIVMDTPFISSENKWDRFLELLDLIEQNDGILVVNWHQRVFREEEFPEYRTFYIKIIEECKKRNAHFATLGEFYNKIISNQL